jgi:hypothetical protein
MILGSPALGAVTHQAKSTAVPVAASHRFVPEATPSARAAVVPAVTPAPIASFVTTSVTDTTVGLSWQYPAASDFTGVVIRQSVGTTAPSSPTSGTAVANVTAPTRTFNAPGLLAGTHYTFAAFGYTAASVYAAGTDLGVTTAPGPVTSLTVTGTTSSTISLSWSLPTGSTYNGVMIRRATGRTAPATASGGTLVARLSRTATSDTDADLTPGSTYSYSLFSYDASLNNSAPTTITGSTTRAAVTTINACANGDAVSTSQTWSPASATAYDVGCTLTLDSGVTLTIDPGTVIKLSGMVLVGSGAHLALGATSGAPVIFTSYRDSKVGGAVTGDGSPHNGDYTAAIELEESSSASITNAVFRYGSASVADGFYAPCGTAGRVKLLLRDSIIDSPVTLGNCTSRGNASYTVSHNTFEVPNTYFAAFQFVRVATDTLSMTSNWFDFAGTTGLTRAIWTGVPVGIDVGGAGDASTNLFSPGAGTTLVGVDGDVPAGDTWTVDLPHGVSLVNSGGPNLEADGTITVGAGTTVGDPSTGAFTFEVEMTGTLDIDGTSSAPIALTNDTAVLVDGSGTTNVTHAVFTGSASTAAWGADVAENTCQPGTENVDLSDNTFDTLVALGQCTGGGASEDLTVTGNRFRRPIGTTFLAVSAHALPMGQLNVSSNTFSPTAVNSEQNPLQPAVVVDGWPLQGLSLAGSGTNLFTGQGSDRAVEVLESTVPLNQTWEVNPAGSDVVELVDTNYQLAPAVTVAGTVLIDPGTVLKLHSGVDFAMQTGGTINVEGSAAKKVTFTSYLDDSVDGDTNGDGPSTGTPAGSGGDYFDAIQANPDSNVSITYATFQDGLFAVEPPYNATPASGGYATISHSTFADELALGDDNGTQVPYTATVTNNTWTFDGATSGNFAAGGGYDPSAEQPAVILSNMDPSGFSLDGSTANTFTGTGAGRVVALLGTTIPADESWAVDQSTGVVLAPWTDYDYLPNAGIYVQGTLSLLPDTVVKSATYSPAIEVANGGTLASAPKVLFDAIADDTVDGDSNGDGGLSSPAIDAYGTAVQFDGSGELDHATIEYASIGVDAAGSASVDLSDNTFATNGTAVEMISETGSSSITNNAFNGNDNSIDAVGVWIPFQSVGLSCQFVSVISAQNNSYGPLVSSDAFLSQSDYDAISAALAHPSDDQTSPSGWFGYTTAGATDDLTGWSAYPCVVPDDPDASYTAIGIPLDFSGS